MKITIRKSTALDDWYLIVRAEHDNKNWWEGSSYRTSERLSPDADIEGDSEEMIALAKAIINRKNISFRRCAIDIEEDVIWFYSPRNSEFKTAISFEDADDFANVILNELGGYQ